MFQLKWLWLVMLWNKRSNRGTHRDRVGITWATLLMRWSVVAWLLASVITGVGQPPDAAQPPRAQETETKAAELGNQGEEDPGKVEPTYHNEVVRGRVVWLAEALSERFGISTVPEVAEQSLAILTTDGEVIPLVENLRGRAFRKDPRLREMQLEVWVRRYDKQPLAQILRLFELKDGQLFEVDYWCDVCAIPMYETGPCACCQDHNRIRKRLVSDAEAAMDEAAPENR